MSLKCEIKKISDRNSQSIPWLVWLLKNPKSRVSLPGKISLYNYNCLHVILGQNFSSSGEASVAGFCMGNDLKANIWHVLVLKIFSRHLYPKKFRISALDWVDFKAGFLYGSSRQVRGINFIDFSNSKFNKDIPINHIRRRLGVCPRDLDLLKSEFQKNSQKKKNRRALILKRGSSWLGVFGAIILALNISISVLGYVFLSLSAFLLGVSDFIDPEKKSADLTIFILIFVNLFGIYRWH